MTNNELKIVSSALNYINIENDQILSLITKDCLKHNLNPFLEGLKIKHYIIQSDKPGSYAIDDAYDKWLKEIK